MAAALISIASPAFAQPALPPPVSVMLRGHKVVVTTTADGHADVSVDNKNLGEDDGGLAPEIDGPYDFPDFSFLLVGFITGGNACEVVYKAVIISDTPKLSGEIGSCVEMSRMSRGPDSMTFTFPGFADGNAQILFTVSAAGVKERDIPTHLTGPAYTPGTDMGAMVLGLDTVDVFVMRAPSQALLQLVGRDLYHEFTYGELEFPFVAVGPYVVGALGGPQMGIVGDVNLVFDHAGHLWVRVDDYPHPPKWYGSPPTGAVAAVKTYAAMNN